MLNPLPPALTIVPPNRPLVGRVSPPGSKSITNRALLLAALANGTSRLTGALKSKDTTLMAAALRQMGVTVEEPGATSFTVTSTGRLRAPAGPLFLGNAGTATRFLAAAVATVDGEVIVDGDDEMRVRPIGPLVTALQSLGIDATSPTGCPPVTIRGKGSFGSGRVEIDGGLSSQYVSALLMAAPLGDGPITVALTGSDTPAPGWSSPLDTRPPTCWSSQMPPPRPIFGALRRSPAARSTLALLQTPSPSLTLWRRPLSRSFPTCLP
jgi:3-phosphoshikimate 1-carboxyvinyltransferase